MPNYKIILEYNGAKFAGSQIQPNKRTVEAELKQVLNLFFGPQGSFQQNPQIETTFSSRTGSGVHAFGQVVNFKLAQEIEDLDNPYQVLAALNAKLPEDMVLTKIQEVPDNFNARFDATAREYLYKIFIRRHRPVLRLDSMAWQKEELDFDKMQAHAANYLGEHDFSAYAKLEEGDSGICNVSKSELIKESPICFKYKIKANRFLRHMVRRMVGELIQVGQGKEASPKFTCPAEGLCLVKVYYTRLANF